jgi:hypothetical protein
MMCACHIVSGTVVLMTYFSRLKRYVGVTVHTSCVSDVGQTVWQIGMLFDRRTTIPGRIIVVYPLHYKSGWIELFLHLA